MIYQMFIALDVPIQGTVLINNNISQANIGEIGSDAVVSVSALQSKVASSEPFLLLRTINAKRGSRRV